MTIEQEQGKMRATVEEIQVVGMEEEEEEEGG